MSKTYAEKLKSPKWQMKRLEIMERDGFQCQCCFSRDDTLTVHHKEYTKGCEPWEYEDQKLITLCEDCHESVHLWEKAIKKHPERFEFLGFDVNVADYRIYRERISSLHKLEGPQSMKTLIQLITGYIITNKDI